MNEERLSKLADYLDTVPDKNFDYAVWYVQSSCGTTACALGHACMIPEFKALGLDLLPWRVVQDNGYRALVPTYQGHEMIAAACKFFDLRVSDAQMLFAPEFACLDEETPEAVATFIREFVSDPTGTREDVCARYRKLHNHP